MSSLFLPAFSLLCSLIPSLPQEQHILTTAGEWKKWGGWGIITVPAAPLHKIPEFRTFQCKPKHLISNTPLSLNKKCVSKEKRWPWLVWLSWLESCPVYRKVEGLIPSWGAYVRKSIKGSLSYQCLTLSLPLPHSLSLLPFSKEKSIQILGWGLNYFVKKGEDMAA